jgi:MaoC dehydratase-like protein
VATTTVVERLRAKIGAAGAPVGMTVEAGHVRRFCEAIGDPSPRWREEAPPTFLVSFGRSLPDLPEALEYGRGWLNGGDRFELSKPVRIGDTITARTTLKDAYEKDGRSGPMLFLVTETVCTDQDGGTVAVITGTRIRR